MFKERTIGWFHFRGNVPGIGSGTSRAIIPAVQLAHMRAAEGRTAQLERLHPHETQHPKYADGTASFRPILGRTLDRLVEYVIAWDQRRRDRRLLASLDDRTLRDLGIIRDTVENDSTASFWRLRSPK